eukprot:13592481-Alexandrium_andersonii.AAC.1
MVYDPDTDTRYCGCGVVVVVDDALSAFCTTQWAVKDKSGKDIILTRDDVLSSVRTHAVAVRCRRIRARSSGCRASGPRSTRLSFGGCSASRSSSGTLRTS